MIGPHLCHIFPCFDVGGPEVRTADLVNATIPTWRHTIISLDGTFGCRGRIHANGDVQFISGVGRGGRPPSPLDVAAQLRTLKPDLVLTYNWGALYGIVAAVLSGIRRVIHAEDGFGPEERQSQKLRRVLARRLLLRRVRRVVLPSRRLMKVASQEWRVPFRLLSYIPNGVDTARFWPRGGGDNPKPGGPSGAQAGERVVGTVGQLRGEKNQARLVRAFVRTAGAQPVRLLIVGEGPLRSELTELVRTLGGAGRVVFTGQVNDPAEWYRRMDVFALCSDTEQMPIAVLEAMSAGLPVVSTDVGDVRDMVSEDNRPYIVPLGDDDRYTGALTRLLHDSSTALALGRANREKCLREYDQARMIRAYVTLYQEVLDRDKA
jgi:glycosyltransferase involved in cell wall biosynthesis